MQCRAVRTTLGAISVPVQALSTMIGEYSRNIATTSLSSASVVPPAMACPSVRARSETPSDEHAPSAEQKPTIASSFDISRLGCATGATDSSRVPTRARLAAAKIRKPDPVVGADFVCTERAILVGVELEQSLATLTLVAPRRVERRA